VPGVVLVFWMDGSAELCSCMNNIQLPLQVNDPNKLLQKTQGEMGLRLGCDNGT
jgi:hypothetical protein